MYEMRAVALLGLLVVLAAAGGCGRSSRTSQKSMVFVDPPHAEELMAGSRKGLLGLGGEKSAIWVDPRSDREYRGGHIKGAVHLPFQRVTEDHETLDAYDLLIVYGKTYNDPLAEAMSKRLIELGHDDVRTLRGGLKAWTDAGHELVGAE